MQPLLSEVYFKEVILKETGGNTSHPLYLASIIIDALLNSCFTLAKDRTVFSILSLLSGYIENSGYKRSAGVLLFFFFPSQKQQPMFSHFLFLSQSCIIQAKTVPHGERLVDTKNRTSSAGPSLQPASTGQKIKIMNLNNCSPPIKFSLVDVLVYIYIIQNILTLKVFILSP